MKLLKFGSPHAIQTPPSALLPQLPQEIRTLCEEVADLRRKYQSATRDLVESEHRRDAVRLKDAEAAGVALRQGKAAPKAKLPAAEAEIQRRALDLEALGTACEAAAVDLAEALEKHGPDCLAALEEEATKQRAVCHEAARALADAVAEGGETAALTAWVKDSYRVSNPAAHGRRPTGLKGRDGEALDVNRLVAELAGAWAPAEPAPPTNPAQALEQPHQPLKARP